MNKSENFDSFINNIAPHIGYLIIAFNSLEESVSYILSETLFDDLEDIGKIVLADKNFYSKIELFERLYNYEIRAIDKVEYLAEFERIIKNLHKARQKRNEIVHAAWLAYGSEHSRIKTKVKIKKEGPQDIYNKITPDSLKADIEFIESLDEELFDFYETRCGWLP